MKNKKINSIQHSEQELAEAIVFPVSLTVAQKKESAALLATAREKSQQEMSSSDRQALQILHLKYQLEDYIRDDKSFNPDFNFGYFLKQYVKILKLKRKDFASEISIDESLLSQFINMHRTPPEYIIVRLEIHSNNNIPATHWYKLIEKEKVQTLRTDKELRKKESRFVRKKIAG
ncbi:hypothetical protein [Flavihumibacter sp. ZG627]|uniref:hypothetical protein n=1 Tax=Flavihumibacter sp. ZG627 TaxID=1463156 RepID=UPI00057DDD5A|nr:hypothetical protein [Flavihumibacter sp. ZG627]KIC92292.1 hypothetical protein HY58_01735 [Flavihumibacter sp. ZG627]